VSYDETLIDLIDDNIEFEYEQIRSTRAILLADQRSRHVPCDDLH
jgi:hypothetical protein